MGVYATLARFIRDSTAVGRALLTAATAGDQRNALGLGTAAQSAVTDFAAAIHNHDDRYFTESEVTSTLASYLTISVATASYQPLDSDLTAIAALTTTTFGRSLLTQADAAAVRTTIGAGSSSFDGAYSSLTGIPSTFTPASHAHGNITNAGAIGSTANLPLITTTSGVITVGAFGSTVNTFCQGNDSRLSDARTPTAHNQAWSTITSTPTTLAGYGITDAITSAAVAAGYQPLDSDLTAIAALTTTTFGRSLLTQADAAAVRTTIGAGTSSFDGAYSSLTGIPSTFTPASHSHGNITNAGAIGDTANLPLITTASGVITVGTFGSTANTFCSGDDSRLSDARTPTAHNQAWSTITSTPTTLAGYGITDGITATTAASTYLALAGGTVTGNVLLSTNTQLQFASSSFRIFSDNSSLFLESTADVYTRRSGTTYCRINQTNATTTLRGVWSPNVCITSSGDITAAAAHMQSSGTDLRFRADGGVIVRNLADSADADLSCRQITVSGPITGTGNLVEIRNATTAQTLDVSGTWTSATNFESLRLRATGSAFQIGSAVGSSGGSNQALQIGRWDAAGTFTSFFRVSTTGLAYIDQQIGDWVNFGTTYQFRAGGGNEISCASNVPLNWSSTTDARGTKDIGIGRNAAGVLEVNNGTLGSLAAISASKYNSVTVTAPATAATLTLANNSSLITSGANALTLTTTATTAATLPSGTVTLLARDSTDTVTNKRLQRRITSTTSASSLTPDISSADFYEYTALAAALTINNPTGTPVNGELLDFRFLDNGTGRSLTWNAAFRSMTATLPSTTIANKTHRIRCEWNATASKWDCLAVSVQP